MKDSSTIAIDTVQPLSLLLKSCQLVTELALYDVVNSPGVATDLSHISSPAVQTSQLYSIHGDSC
jgi:malate/lactate dehydrogenase